MSATRETTIWCDGEGCGLWERVDGNAETAREWLKRYGRWIRKGNKDFCPDCSKKNQTTGALTL